MKDNGFELDIPKDMDPRYSQILRQDYFENDLGSFRKVIENIDEIE